MRLEDLRSRRVGDAALFLDGTRPIPAAFHDHALQAQWHTTNGLLRLAGNHTDRVVNERIAVVEWWRMLESLVKLLHLVALKKSRLSLQKKLQRLHIDRNTAFNNK